MDIGKIIKKRRKEIGMSADALGEKIGKSRATIFRYENGDIENMPIDILKPIAEALQTTPAHLMGWDQEEIDAASEQIEDKNAYSDSKEEAINDFMEEISEMSLSTEDFEILMGYAETLSKPNMTHVVEKHKRLFELNLTDDEFEEVYKYAQFIISKRN